MDRLEIREMGLARMVNRLYIRWIADDDSRAGDYIRLLVSQIADRFRRSPKELEPYFNNQDPLVAGVASAAYLMITGTFHPATDMEHGGLGAKITGLWTPELRTCEHAWQDPEHPPQYSLVLSGHQFQLARVAGSSLYEAVIKDRALQGSVVQGELNLARIPEETIKTLTLIPQPKY